MTTDGTAATTLKPVELFYVLYQDGDHFGHFLAWISLFPLFAFISCAALAIIGRSRSAANLAAGQVFGEVVNQVLKKIFKQPRPSPFSSLDKAQSCLWRSDSKTGGMPSDHCQYMAFLAVYCCFAFRNVRGNFIVVVLALLNAFSRVYLSYHTVDQAAAGLLVGCILGYVWALARPLTSPMTNFGMFVIEKLKIS